MLSYKQFQMSKKFANFLNPILKCSKCSHTFSLRIFGDS